jgi:hypothetical protein
VTVTPSQVTAPGATSPAAAEAAPAPSPARSTVQAPHPASSVVTPTAGRHAAGGPARPALADLLAPSTDTAQAAPDESRAMPTAPAQAVSHESSQAPTALAAPSGAAGVAGPAPSGGGALFALSLAAICLAAALWFTRLLHPPAQWRPVFLVSLIERPG